MDEFTAAYVGDYRLEQVRTQPHGLQALAGRLHLYAPDSAVRRQGRYRGLIGWLEPEVGDTAWRQIVGSRDPMSPGAVLQQGRLRIGQNGMLDGVGNNLVIMARAPDGFWGWWTADEGMGMQVATPQPPVTAGYFCAQRLPVADTASGA